MCRTWWVKRHVAIDRFLDLYEYVSLMVNYVYINYVTIHMDNGGTINAIDQLHPRRMTLKNVLWMSRHLTNTYIHHDDNNT